MNIPSYQEQNIQFYNFLSQEHVSKNTTADNLYQIIKERTNYNVDPAVTSSISTYLDHVDSPGLAQDYALALMCFIQNAAADTTPETEEGWQVWKNVAGLFPEKPDISDPQLEDDMRELLNMIFPSEEAEIGMFFEGGEEENPELIYCFMKYQAALAYLYYELGLWEHSAQCSTDALMTELTLQILTDDTDGELDGDDIFRQASEEATLFSCRILQTCLYEFHKPRPS